MRSRRVFPVLLGLAAVLPVIAVAPAAAGPVTSGREPTLARSPELTVSTRLADRRSFIIGTRFYEVGAENASYPAEGFHTRGEMGGFWSMPIKLLDGVWFGVNGSWLSARSYSNGWGYARMNLGVRSGVQITRTDVAPDGLRAGLIGLTFTSAAHQSLQLTLDAHSELMKSYPWGSTTPDQLTYNLPDTGSYQNGALVFRERGTPPVSTARPHDWAAVVGSTLQPSAHALGSNYRGPQSGDVVCPATGTAPARCDDTAFGKGTGGQLQYTVDVPAGSRTVWFTVAGSDEGLPDAQDYAQQALRNPAQLLAAKVRDRVALARQTDVYLPGDPLLAQSVAWSKQNLADARQQADDLELRVTNAGTKYPPPTGSLETAKWIGAGWPDYPWIFGTDGEYTAFAAVAAGQFSSIEDHLRTLQQVSDQVNNRSGKVVHEVVPDGSVYFGANSDPGNTDETVKFPSAVALVWRWTGDNRFRDEMYDFTVRNMRYVFTQLDADHDGWPEGAGNVERPGMGQEKLDVSVYAIRGLLDLADMAASKHDLATVRWASGKASDLLSRFERTWWYGGGTRSYADSLADPGNHKLFQRYWIGLTPVEAELPASGSAPAEPLAAVTDLADAVATVEEHQLPCYTGTYGLYHTGTGPTSDPKGNPGPSCDHVLSSAPSDREVFTLNTAIAAVAEAALGRMGPGQTQRYTDDNATVQVDPAVIEAPGDMPEISPSPDFGANIDKSFLERSSGLQAWGTYGVLWPVVHYELGVAPDLGHGAVSIVPQVPNGQSQVAARDIALGTHSMDVLARRANGTLTTAVSARLTGVALTLGVLLPSGTHASAVRLDGRAVSSRTVQTARGTEVLVSAPANGGTLTVRFS